MTSKKKPFDTWELTPAELATIRRNSPAELYGYGDEAPANHPIRTLVATAVSDYNRTHPHANLQMPKFIRLYQSPMVNAAYVVEPDALIFSTEAAQLPKPMLKAAIAHELGHKHEYETKGAKKVRFNLDALIAATRPDTVKHCVDAGITEANTYAQLPGNQKIWRPSGMFNNNALAIQDEIKHIDNAYYKADRLGWVVRKVTTWFTTDCANDIEAVWAALPDATRQLEAATIRQNHDIELRADAEARITYGAKPLADLLAKTAADAPNPLRSPDDSIYDHPSSQQRVEAIGCKLVSMGLGNYTTSCPPEPQATPPAAPPKRSGKRH